MHYIIMDLLDYCFYQTGLNKPCPFSNSTCHCCPWSLRYRNAWRSRELLVESRHKIADFPCYYRFS